jgi:hypothetical protein
MYLLQEGRKKLKKRTKTGKKRRIKQNNSINGTIGNPSSGETACQMPARFF